MYKILLVEGEYLSSKVMELIITREFKENVKVITADNGLKGKKIIEEQDIDLSIIDVNLPIISGIELCKYIKIRKKDMPIMMITGDYDDARLTKKLFKLEANEYFIKPIRKETVIKLIKKYIDDDIKELKNKKENYLKDIFKCIAKESKTETENKIEEYISYLYEQSELTHTMKEVTILAERIVETCKKYDIVLNDKIISKINALCENPFMYREKGSMINYFMEIIDEIFSEISKFDKNNNFNIYIQEAINYVENNIKKNITLEEVAKHINITPHYLSKIFKKEVGVNFVTYITDRKIELAKEMLADQNIPIINISITLSFNQANYFSKVFKKRVGVTPSEYREQCLKNSNSYINNI